MDNIYRKINYNSSQFTLYHDQIVSQKINTDLQKIVNGILQILRGKIIAIYLVGGFGRGEGGVIVEQNNVNIVNDYDILVVLKNNFKITTKYLKLVDKFADNIASELEVKQVDIQLTYKWQLGIPKNSVDRYEKKYGHYLLYGKATPIRFIGKIPIREGFRYLYNRGNGLLLNYVVIRKKLYKKNKYLAQELIINNNKAILAMGDALLIAHGMYHYSYAERMRRIVNLPWKRLDIDDELILLYQKAIDFKIFPVKEELNDITTAINQYLQIVKNYSIFVEWYKQKYNSIKIFGFLLNYPKKYCETFNLLKQIAQCGFSYSPNPIIAKLIKWHSGGIIKEVI